MKIITIIGARPQFIKSALLSRALRQYADVEEIIIHTGQHFDTNMSDVFFSDLELSKPTYNLAVNGHTHGVMTGLMMAKIEPILIDEQPDVVIVYGDTNSTLAGALAAKKLHFKLAHIEAGLRSYNMQMPEEVNRIVVDRISDLLFCPTSQAMQNLALEGFQNYACRLYNYGDVMYDAALHYGKIALQKSTVKQQLGLTKFVLATMHRAENIDDSEKLMQIVEALNHIHSITPVVVPVHPRTQMALEKLTIDCDFICTKPLGYFDMLALLQESELVITDSGGLQKEAYFFNRYCITMREETEWEELVTHGFNVLSGCHTNKIIEGFMYFKTKTSPPENIQLYGNGNAAELMAAAIVKG